MEITENLDHLKSVTFEYAQQERHRLVEKYGIQYSKRNKIQGIYIVPAIVSELLQYQQDFENKNFDDEIAKQYSSNNRYTLFWKEIE
ncbi:hypothetical protein [Flavobacterium sp. KACC 22763]|uniref:hypothetical protein n=1 Tax=Flavobacterium sp. KACC 22763 TaxID=3025668 RepID=UPI00236592C9|nr:hypothetical protein [Flavobacterium sp. KACC 22763]WDF65650.1 hypothetical protein PQ463_05655 [Flavobacterium sp. KACC 22763]